MKFLVQLLTYMITTYSRRELISRYFVEQEKEEKKPREYSFDRLYVCLGSLLLWEGVETIFRSDSYTHHEYNRSIR